MPELTLSLVSEILGAPVTGNIRDMNFSHYHFDTRQIPEDETTLFFALKSDHNDGHAFLHRLKNRKNVAAVVSCEYSGGDHGIPMIPVNDPLKAAHRLARHIRDTHKKTRFIGVTGSAGKTTTKEFIYQLAAHRFRAFRSFENWNNWIGLPFSMLMLQGDEDVAVFELAMSYPGIGEIDLLSEILRPDVAVILNVYPVHLEYLKNLENIALAKTEILNYLTADDMAFIAGDFDLVREISRSKSGRKVYFGKKDKNNDVVLKEVVRKGDETHLVIDFFGKEDRFHTAIINHSQIENLFAAILVVQHLGFKNHEIQDALKKIKPLSGRGEIKKVKQFTTIDETYNSNPEALNKTLSWIDREYTDQKIAVIGDMLELGDDERHFHLKAGEYFSTLSYDYLITVGERARKIAEGARKQGFENSRISSFDQSRDAGVFLKSIARPGCVILFKGSRGIRLEEALQEFVNG